LKNINRVHKTGDVFLHEEVYEPGITTGELIQRMKDARVDLDAPMYCDSAEPDRIKEIRAAGFNAKGQIKSAGSVNAGINALQTMKLHCTGDSKNLIAEFGGYVWNTAVKREEPVKANDHAMDAFRAAVYTRLKRPEPTLFSRVSIGV
jgi:phage terminase large subunit